MVRKHRRKRERWQYSSIFSVVIFVELLNDPVRDFEPSNPSTEAGYQLIPCCNMIQQFQQLGATAADKKSHLGLKPEVNVSLMYPDLGVVSRKSHGEHACIWYAK